MPVVARTMEVQSSPEAVWRFVSDFTTTEEWDPPTVATERTSGDGGLGSTYHNVVKLHGRRTEVDYVVTEHDEGRAVAWRGTAWGLMVLTRIVIVPLDEGRVEVDYESRITVLNDDLPAFEPAEVVALGELVGDSLLDSLEHLVVEH